MNKFKSLMKEKKPDALLPWMNKAANLGLPEPDTFINGLKQDIDAVMNAIVSDFSNGLIEGTVNKIKNKCLLLDYAT